MARTERRHGSSATARRDALLQATVAVAAEEGTAAITHRAVTERAGLPLATVSYFFDSIDDLAEEALRVFAGAWSAQLVALAEQLERGHSTPDEVAAAFAAVAAPRVPDTPAMIEAYLHASRVAGFRQAVGEALDASRRIAAAAARAAGAPEPEAGAAAFAALADGFALHRLAVPDRVGPDDLYRAFRALFLGYLLDQGHVELAVRLAT